VTDLTLQQERRLAARELVRTAVFDHYGWSCACCGTTVNLSIDHLNGNGREHRIEIFGELAAGDMYGWLVRNGFPGDFQTLCRPCNSSKGKGALCRIDHAPREAPAETLSLPPGFEIFPGERLYWVDGEPWTFGSLAGLAEIACLARPGHPFSRQRAWQLTRRPDFPEPAQVLAMGPVWREADVQKFLDTERKPGRKPKRGAES
jgi:hypothetical protein